MARCLSLARGLAAILCTIGLCALMLAPSRTAADDQQSLLASVISKALSSPDITVRVGAVEGALSSRSTIRDIVLSDHEGVFLTVDQVQLDWRRAALLGRRLEVEQLLIGRIDWQRLPRPSGKARPDHEPLLPELPVKVQIKAFELAELAIAPAVAGHAARFGATGRASLGPPAEGLETDLSIRRLDRDGSATLRLAFVPNGEMLDLGVSLREPAGGLVATLAGIPGAPPVNLAVAGRGALDDWASSLDVSAGPGVALKGTTRVLRDGPARRIVLDLGGTIDALLPPVAAELLAGQVTLNGEVRAREDARLQFDRIRLASRQVEIEASGTAGQDLTLDLGVKAVARPGKDGITRHRDFAVGTLSLEAQIQGSAKMPRVAGRLLVRELKHPDISIAQANADVAFAMASPIHASRLSGTVNATGLAVAGQAFSRASLMIEERQAGTGITMDAKGPAAEIQLRAVVHPGDETRIALAELSAARGAARIRMLAPTTVLVKDGDASTEGMRLAFGGGTLRLSGRAGRTMALRVNAEKVALANLRAIAPGLAVSGVLDAEAELGGSLAAPTGPYRVRIQQLAHQALGQAGIASLDVTARGALAGEKASLDAQIKGGASLALAVKGQAPLTADGRLDLQVTGTLDAALANRQLAAGQRVTGRVQIDGAIKGVAAKPQIEGAATFAGASWVDSVQGMRFSNISGRILGAGDRLRIERLTATTPGDGTIALSGSVLLDPARGMPADLALSGRKARLVENDVVILESDLDLAISGPLAGVPTIAGVMQIGKMDVLIPDRFASVNAPFAKARHLEAPPETRARLAVLEQRSKARERRRSQGQGGARLAIRLDAPSRIFVRGRGLDAELGGSLQLGGTLHAPRANGNFELRRGQIDLLTQRLEFSQGHITFTGDVIPEIDFSATTSAGDIAAKLAVTGRADAPAFTLSSEPQLPSDEILARLLFERAAGTLSPLQAIQLAQAVARLSGQSNLDVLDRTRKALGVDSLDVSTGKNGVNVGAARYITRDIRIGVKTGAMPEDTGVSASFDVTRRIKLKGEATRDGRGSVGVAAEIEY